jgi:ADP-ribosylglycohydrolase
MGTTLIGKMNVSRDRVLGMLLGVSIGDKLASVVEGKTPEWITEHYGRITTYVEGSHTTDDTQLTLAVAEGMIESPFNMKVQAKKHVEAFKESTQGWGSTTREAIRDIANGCSWSKSGQSVEGRGKGNGVAMKIAPIAAFIRHLADSHAEEEELLKAFTFVRDLTVMTHKTQMAVAASFAHVVALAYCLANQINVKILPDKIVGAAKKGLQYAADLPEETDNIIERFERLKEVKNHSPMEICQEFGNLSCYCYNSVPGSHALFLRMPYQIDCLYDTVAVGGDTDTTASLVGSLLGALNGSRIFPESLIDGVKDQVCDVVDRLCGKLGIER